MLILAGPEGSGRVELAHRLVEEFSEFFGYGFVNEQDFMIPNGSARKISRMILFFEEFYILHVRNENMKKIVSTLYLSSKNNMKKM